MGGGKSNNISGNGNNGTAASSESGSGNQPASGESITEKVRNNPAFNEAMKGVTYTSTSTSTNNKNSKKEEQKTNDKPATMLDKTKNALQATGANDLLRNFTDTNK